MLRKRGYRIIAEGHERHFKQFCMGALLLLMGLPLCVNHKPLCIISNNNHVLFPIFETITWQQLGKSRDIRVDYESNEFQQFSKEIPFILWPLWRTGPWSEVAGDAYPLSPKEYPIFGTDINGHDLLVHTLYGLRVMLLFAFVVSLLSGVLGVILGMFQGFFQGRIDFMIQRVQEIMSGIPLLYILMILQRDHQPSLWLLMLTIVPLNWFVTARIMRAASLKIMAEPFMQNATFLRISKARQLFLFLFPLLWGGLKRWLPMLMAGAISILVTLDILGFGLAQDMPSLGRLILQGKNNLDATWILCVPVVFIILTVFCVILWGQLPSKKSGEAIS